MAREPAGREDGEGQAEGSARNADEKAFGHLFADEGGAAATEGETHGNLFAAGCAACYEQIRDVEAGDQEHASYGTEKDDERCLHVLDEIVDHRSKDGVFGHGARCMCEMD